MKARTVTEKKNNFRWSHNDKIEVDTTKFSCQSLLGNFRTGNYKFGTVNWSLETISAFEHFHLSSFQAFQWRQQQQQQQSNGNSKKSFVNAKTLVINRTL